MSHNIPDTHDNPSLSEFEGGHQSKISRRRFLRVGVIGGALAAAGASRLPTSEASTTSKVKYALIVDTTKCTGCGACADACNLRNDLPQDMSYIRYCSQGNDGSEWCLPVQCQHCADAPCETVCPTGATYHTKDGVVLVNEKLCVGCRYCEVACPYQARRFDHEKGVANKCWLCLDYVLGGGEPACVHACLHGARLFGRLDDPESEVSKIIASGAAEPFHPEFETDPAILYYVLK